MRRRKKRAVLIMREKCLSSRLIDKKRVETGKGRE